MTIYQAHPTPDLSGWVDKLVPDIAGARASAQSAALNILSTTEKLRQSRAKFAVDMQTAKLNTDLLRSEMKRNEILWNEKNMKLAAEAKMETLRLEAAKGRANIDSIARATRMVESTEQARNDYLPQLNAALELEDRVKYGQILHRMSQEPYFADLVGGDMDPKILKKDFNDEQKREIEASQMDAYQGQVDVNMQLLQLERSEANAQQAKTFLQYPPSELGSGGDKQSTTWKLNVTMAKRFEKIANLLSESPDAEYLTDKIKTAQSLSEIFKTNNKIERQEERTPIRALFSREVREAHVKRGSLFAQNKEAKLIYDQIRTFSKKIDSSNKTTSQNAQTVMVEYLNEISESLLPKEVVDGYQREIDEKRLSYARRGYGVLGGVPYEKVATQTQQDKFSAGAQRDRVIQSFIDVNPGMTAAEAEVEARKRGYIE